MASGAGPALAHRSVASIRSAPSQGLSGPSSPHTPQRPINSNYGSPSAIRADDDIIIIQLGSRRLRAGFGGDSAPKAVLSCGPDDQRRVGDFRAWQGNGQTVAARDAWASEYEIWQCNLRELDLGLFRDKLDRLLREAFTKYLLVDSKPRRVSLVLDSAVPIPLLSTVLDTLFDRFPTPMVSLITSPLATAVAAGVRSALVVHLGWAETVVTSLYEYREVKNTRTVRGGKLLHEELYKTLRSFVNGDAEEGEGGKRVVSFEECEDILYRLMWCRSSAFKSSQRQSAQLETVEEQDESEAEAAQGAQRNKVVTIPLDSSDPPSTVGMPFERLADVCDDTYFDPSASPATFDDHELPVHLLVYQHLLQLPVDVRAICMSRIVFTGGCSNILGIKERIIDEMTSMVERRGWEPVFGKRPEQLRNKPPPRQEKTGQTSEPPTIAAENMEGQTESPRDSWHSEQSVEPIEAKIARNRPTPQQLQGQIRAIHSLGPWTGASLLSQLRVPAIATIDRELWLQQGANGASRAGEVDIKAQQRQSMGPSGLIRGSGGAHTNWTLGNWGAL